VLPIITSPLREDCLTEKHIAAILDSLYPEMEPGAAKIVAFDIFGLVKRLRDCEMVSAETKVSLQVMYAVYVPNFE
jgi:hypothetical protein